MEDTAGKSTVEPVTIDAGSSLETRAEEFFRKWAPPVVLIGVGLWGFFAGGFLAYHSWKGGFIVRIVEEHFPGMILVPMAALMALCIVLLLRWTTGALEFDLWGQAAIWLLGPLESGPTTRTETPNNGLNLTAQQRSCWVPSALRASAAG
jgi:hypothetical protein